MENTNKILPPNTIPKDRGAWKSLSLAIVSFLLQTATWFFLHKTTITNPSTLNWVWLTLIAACAISVTTFFLLVNKTKFLAELLIIFSAATYFVISPHNIFVWIGGLIFALFALWYEHRIHGEVASRVDFKVTRVIGGSVSILVYAILLLLGFNIYYNVSTDFRDHPDKFYNELGQQAAKTVPYFSKALPLGVDLNEPLSQFVDQQAQKDPQYQNASSFEREILVSEAKKAFQEQFNITASDNQSLADIMAEVAVNKIRDATAPYQDYLPIIFTILIVGLLYTFAFLIRWTILLISWVLFQILRSIGFFHLEKVQIEVEKLVV